jgi:hypothetical protein
MTSEENRHATTTDPRAAAQDRAAVRAVME